MRAGLQREKYLTNCKVSERYSFPQGRQAQKINWSNSGLQSTLLYQLQNDICSTVVELYRATNIDLFLQCLGFYQIQKKWMYVGNCFPVTWSSFIGIFLQKFVFVKFICFPKLIFFIFSSMLLYLFKVATFLFRSLFFANEMLSTLSPPTF